jgi:hypothetical protein
MALLGLMLERLRFDRGASLVSQEWIGDPTKNPQSSPNPRKPLESEQNMKEMN